MSDYELPAAGTVLTCIELRGCRVDSLTEGVTYPVILSGAGMMNPRMFTRTPVFVWLRTCLPSQGMTVRQFYWKVWTVTLRCSPHRNCLCIRNEKRCLWNCLKKSGMNYQHN